MEKTYAFAGIFVLAEYSHSYIKNQCVLYESNLEPQLKIAVHPQDIANERLCMDDAFSDGYLESLAFYRKLAEAAVDYDVLLLHGSAIEFEGKAYIYTAPSGTGKSTHAALCKKVFGERIRYINDDKPLLRFVDGVWYVYGTPWDGKHNRSTNSFAPLGGICFLRRGETNRICRVSPYASIGSLLSQIYRPKEQGKMEKTLTLAISLSEAPLWELQCNVSEEAALLSLGAMNRR